MSTLAYAAITSRRDQATPGTSTTSDPPGIQTYLDALAALVPAELLALHAAILTYTTSNVDNTVIVRDVTTLFVVFWALLGLGALIYAAGRLTAAKWDRLDWIRMLIPPAAFAAWTMLQKATAFDAVVVHWSLSYSASARSATAMIAAVVLGIVASLLAYSADQKIGGPGGH